MSVKSDMSDKEFEDLLMKSPTSKNDIQGNDEPFRRVTDYYTEVLSMFGKLPIIRCYISTALVIHDTSKYKSI